MPLIENVQAVIGGVSHHTYLHLVANSETFLVEISDKRHFSGVWQRMVIVNIQWSLVGLTSAAASALYRVSHSLEKQAVSSVASSYSGILPPTSRAVLQMHLRISE